MFVDVGAAGPEFLSMSALYREAGWRVIAVEPNPVFCAMHRAAGQEVLEYACADFDADDAAFQVVDLHGDIYEGGRVSFESFSALEVKPAYRQLREQLDTRTVRVGCAGSTGCLPSMPPISIESTSCRSTSKAGKLEVLAGFSLERYRPRAVIVENLFDDPTYPRALARRGYQRWLRRDPNDVYVRAPFWRRLLTLG